MPATCRADAAHRRRGGDARRQRAARRAPQIATAPRYDGGLVARRRRAAGAGDGCLAAAARSTRPRPCSNRWPSTRRPSGRGRRRLRAVTAERISVRELEAAEEALFAVATAEPLEHPSVSSPRARARGRSRATQASAYGSARTRSTTRRPRRCGTAFSRHVDTDLADSVSRATTGGLAPAARAANGRRALPRVERPGSSAARSRRQCWRAVRSGRRRADVATEDPAAASRRPAPTPTAERRRCRRRPRPPRTDAPTADAERRHRLAQVDRSAARRPAGMRRRRRTAWPRWWRMRRPLPAGGDRPSRRRAHAHAPRRLRRRRRAARRRRRRHAARRSWW